MITTRHIAAAVPLPERDSAIEPLTCSDDPQLRPGAPPMVQVTSVKRSDCVVYPLTGAECCMR